MMKPQQIQPESRTQTILILCLILFLFNVPTVKPTPTHTQQKQKAAAAAETFLHPFIPLHVNWEQGSGEWGGGAGGWGAERKVTFYDSHTGRSVGGVQKICKCHMVRMIIG